jgi:hypothetical protein
MALNVGQADQAVDPTAITNSFLALDAVCNAAWGAGILTGLTCNGGGTILAGTALIGHVVRLAANTTALSVAVSNGTWDVYLQMPEFVYNGTTNLGTVGTYPASDGTDSGTLVAVVSGAGAPSGGPSVLVCTVVISGGAFSSANNAPTGRVNLGLRRVPNQVVTGTFDSSNTSFTLPMAGVYVELYLTGKLLRPTTDYTVSGTAITMVTAPGSTDWLMAHLEVVG